MSFDARQLGFDGTVAVIRDLLVQRFRVKADSRVQFRAEIFNALNTAQFDLPNASIGAAQAGTITGIVGTPRQIQFGAKFLF